MSEAQKKARKGATRSPSSPEEFAARGVAAQKAADAAVARATIAPARHAIVELEQLQECPWNPRTTYDKAQLAELAANLGQVGLLQPLLVRPRPSRGSREAFEIVFGHRRFRAAKLAGLERVPVEIRELDDAAVLEVQMVENVQRADLSPIDEGRGYKRMIEAHKLTADQVAERVGVSRSTVYERLRLLELPEKAAAALLDGRLQASTAGLILRIGDPRAREEATKKILGGSDRWDSGAMKGEKPEPLSFRQARQLVREEFLLELQGAPWELDDAKLVPLAGACRVCPKRSGNIADAGPGLGVTRPDVCTDGACFRSKLDAAWTKRSAAHVAAGGTLLPEKRAKGIFSSHSREPRLNHNSGYVAKDQACWEGSANGKRWGDVIRKAKANVPSILARAPSGAIVELYPEAAAKKAVPFTREQGRLRSSTDAKLKAERKKAKREADERRAVLRAFEGAPTSSWPSDPKRGQKILRALGLALEDQAGWEETMELAKAAAPDGKAPSNPESFRTDLRKRLESESGNEALRAALGLALACALSNERGGYGSARAKAVCELVLGVAGLKRSKIAQLAEKGGAKPQAAKKAAPKVRVIAVRKGGAAVRKALGQVKRRLARRAGRKS